MDQYLEFAVNNIIAYGDTDVFPFPIENHIFHDKQSDVISLLSKMHAEFDEFFYKCPPINQNALAAVGYTGFRWATQIDPVWNAYFLALVISLGSDIEDVRIKPTKNVVFSYRYNPDKSTYALWNPKIGWPEFQKRSLELADEFSHVLICDIADFYSRIYHHRLENALTQVSSATDAHKRIMKLLQHFSNNNSYGLPVGGPAARLLAELVLNRTDKLFASHGIKFCRFADDYHVFANSQEEAYQHLVFMSEKLLRNEGLSLQKAKTRIISTKEFKSASEFFTSEEGSGEFVEARRFLTLSLRYDPYSPTAEEDYEDLRSQVERFDISGMLGRELTKSRIHGPLTKKLVRAIKFLPSKQKNAAVVSLVDNFVLLSPVFPVVMIALRDIFPSLKKSTQDYLQQVLRELITNKSHIAQIDVNLAFIIRIMALKYSDENEEVLVGLYKSSTSEIVKRDVILIMAKWNAAHWVSDVKTYFGHLNHWERRAFIIASYILGDEGRHWRDHAKKEFTPIDLLYRDWCAGKASGSGFSVPI